LKNCFFTIFTIFSFLHYCMCLQTLKHQRAAALFSLFFYFAASAEINNK
jgi:hypothetical protein